MILLHHDAWFTFRFAEGWIISRFHLEGVEAGWLVSVFKIDPDTGARLGLLATTTVGEGEKTNNRFSMQQIVASLRTFLRRLHAEGVLRDPLHQQIDTARTYRLEQLPHAWPWDQILALLRSVDCSNPGGLRDFTLLYLAACYGLRSGELVRLTLDNIDWRAGTLTIRQTKTKQTLLLPLSAKSLAVLARYLSAGRPPSAFRELFLRRKAPAGPLAATAVHDILERRVPLSGLRLPPLGGHALRHSFAVHLLRQGVSLPAIGAGMPANGRPEENKRREILSPLPCPPVP